MMKTLLSIALLLLLLPACKKEEAAANTALPPALLVDGAPADVMCFSDILLGEETENIPLRNCGAGLKPGETVVKDEGRTLFADYTFDGDDAGEMGRPWTQYTYLGESGGAAALLLNWSGGGSGSFSTILLVTREGDALKIGGSFAGGDRCNGGITGASVDSEGRVLYSRHITPHDMLMIGDIPADKIAAAAKPGDFDDCAACCYGTAQFVNADYTGVTISTDASFGQNEKEKQQCLDRFLKDKIDAGTTAFSVPGWSGFMAEVDKSCLDLTGE